MDAEHDTNVMPVAARGARAAEPRPERYRWSIRVAALVAMGTWWGVGLPYSLYAWLLDPKQLHWVLICYAWEVPVCGLLGPLLFPLLWFRAIERRWQRVFDGERVDVAEAMALERTLLDYPTRAAVVLLITSLLGYAVGALQVRLFAQLPVGETVKIAVLGLVTGLVGALFAFLYLEWLLAPLLRRLGGTHAVTPTAGRRVPLYVKVFACSLTLTVTTLLLLATIFYSRGERILEEQIGARVLAETQHLADDLAGAGMARADDATWWRGRVERMQLGRSGSVHVVAADGTIVGGDRTAPQLTNQGFRPATVDAVLRSGPAHLVDRVYDPRIVAFAPVAGSFRRVVAVVYRREFAAELDGMLRRAGVVFVMTLLLALSQGFLFSRRLTRPIEILTAMASTIARGPGDSWRTVRVRTNDEVGELATAFNQMTVRLADARAALERYSAELEQRVAAATRNISSLHDVARATTSTLELEDVLKLVAEKTCVTLALSRLVLLWYPPDVGEIVDAYATAIGEPGVRLELTESIDLAGLCTSSRPTVVDAHTLAATLPSAVAAAAIAGERTLVLPLIFKDQLLGVVLGGMTAGGASPDLELAAALASQAATALANAALFETARRHEAELRKLTGMRMQLQEENLRSLSRELHDGVGQVLTAIKIDLGMIERAMDGGDAALRARIGEAREQVTGLVQEIRTMSQLLRPSMLDDFGLVPTLQWLTERFSARTHVVVELRTPASELRLPGAIEVLLYRVTQEALTNIMKHARAHHVEVELRVGGGEVGLRIADDGVGFDVERFRRTPAVGGVGLLGMRERVAYYNGRLDIRSRPGGGVQIALALPLETASTGSDGSRGRIPLAG
jgi:two-component system NarL family sensor kinase